MIIILCPSGGRPAYNHAPVMANLALPSALYVFSLSHTTVGLYDAPKPFGFGLFKFPQIKRFDFEYLQVCILVEGQILLELGRGVIFLLGLTESLVAPVCRCQRCAEPIGDTFSCSSFSVWGRISQRQTLWKVRELFVHDSSTCEAAHHVRAPWSVELEYMSG